MNMIKVLVATLALGVASLAEAAPVSPLDSGKWFQAARMSDSDAGMFDGNGKLRPTYSYGTYVSENQADDFARPFDVWAGMDILFITGNGNIWAMSDYATLRTTIDAAEGRFDANFFWDATSLNPGGQAANILDRGAGVSEDPWISLYGTHLDAVFSYGSIIWGENDYNNPLHTQLKNNNGGVNVWVSVAPVPIPASMLLLGTALMGMAAVRRRRREA